MHLSELIPISLSTLSPSSVIGTDLYCREGDTDQARLFRGANYPMASEDLNKLKSRGVTQLFIQMEARDDYQHYLREVASGDGNVTSSQRVSALNDVVLEVLATSFQKRDVDNTVDAAADLGGIAAEIISRDDFAAKDMMRVLHHDYATFTHSANVAFYAGILGEKLGYSRTEVEQIVAGGLLHDLGKLDIKDSILAKPGRLDEEEFRQIQQHPLVGFRQLAHRDDLGEGQLMMVYQHHEKMKGGGYPVGICGEDMHPWAKLCAVVDVYEAVTSHRPYRKPMTRMEALNLLRRESGDSLDPEIVKCWISIIQTTMPS